MRRSGDFRSRRRINTNVDDEDLGTAIMNSCFAIACCFDIIVGFDTVSALSRHELDACGYNA